MGGHLFRGQSFAVIPVIAQGVPDIHDREDARRERNLLALQAARVAAAVPFFMVAIGDVEGGFQEGDG